MAEVTGPSTFLITGSASGLVQLTAVISCLRCFASSSDPSLFDCSCECVFEGIEVIMLVSADDGLQCFGFVEQLLRSQPCIRVKKIFDLLFLEVRENQL